MGWALFLVVLFQALISALGHFLSTYRVKNRQFLPNLKKIHCFHLKRQVTSNGGLFFVGRFISSVTTSIGCPKGDMGIEYFPRIDGPCPPPLAKVLRTCYGGNFRSLSILSYSFLPFQKKRKGDEMVAKGRQ